MFSVKILALLLTTGLVFSSPTRQENDADSSIEAAEAKTISDVSNHLEDPQKVKEEDTSDCSNSSEENTPEGRISLLQPTSELPADYIQPSVPTSLPSYQTYPGYPNVEAMGIGVGNYRGFLIPYVHPKLLAAYNARFNVNALPPVVSTYIHGLLPQEEVRRSRYELDLPSNAEYLPALARSARMLRDSDGDLLAQLKHDAIMNNIIPTMAVRYAATPAPVSYGAAGALTGASSGGVSALFPAGSSKCAQPILFSCTPRIIYGTLRRAYPEPAIPGPIAHVPVPAPVYRDHAEESDDVDKHVAPANAVNKPTDMKQTN